MTSEEKKTIKLVASPPLTAKKDPYEYIGEHFPWSFFEEGAAKEIIARGNPQFF